MECPNATRVGDQSIRCSRLREDGAKWDLCIHQYFCRDKGKYDFSKDAAQCKIREREVR